MTLDVYDFDQRSDEWYAARRGILTASVIGQLVTKTLKVADNDYSRAIVAQLVAERITGETEGTYTNDDMMRGILDEPLAVDKYAEHYAPVTTTGFMVRREDDWTLGYSPDGLVGADGMVEVKCPRAKTHLQTILTDAVPERNVAQLQAGLLVTGRAYVDFISYFGGMPLFVKRVEPDPAWHAAITEACQRFEETVAWMLADYAEATKNMPATERMEITI